MSEFKSLNNQLKFEGKITSVYESDFIGPNGEQITREITRHPGAVCVVPIIASEVVMIRQFRPAIGDHLLEIPAGKRDIDGESPDVTAHRELQEEVGLSTNNLIELAQFFNSPGFCDEYSYCYLALDCEDVSDDRQGLEEEYMTIERVSISEALTLLTSGQIVDAKTIIGLSLALQYLNGR
ncbi:MAG: ADP-ribose pyrophosphatase [Actinobacteria bacterium]|nr:ADP-ribose pyrophosphatase [Actinomycetota bacterium]